MKQLYKLLTLALMLCSVVTAQAQQRVTVNGVVTDASDSTPLIGVSIITGPGTGVTTGVDGAYSVTVTEGTTLIFQYLGYKTTEWVVSTEEKSIRHDVALELDVDELEEVVVVAYGTRKKGTIAGSVSTVKSEKLESVPAAGFDQALQGQSAGLMVLSNSGEPSKAATFQIRGTNSINSGTSPLFILDGVPISSSDFNAISPSDIESVSVLKDASSSSIYGARAANGVVVITTKRGTTSDDAKITFRSQLGISQLAHGSWNLMNTSERIEFEKEIGLDAGKNYDILSKTDINWLDVVFNDQALLHSYDLSISRATDKMNYYVSGSFYDQDGIAQGSTFCRYNMRANTDVKASKWLRVGTNAMIVFEEVQQAEDGEYALYSPISASRFMLPYWNPYREDGTIASEKDGSWKGTGQNPLEWMENNQQFNKKFKTLATLFAEVTPIKDLAIRTQVGADFTNSTAFMQSMPSYAPNNGIGAAGRAAYNTLNLTITNTATYSKKIDNRHSLNFLLGQEGVDYHYEGFQLITEGQNNDYLNNLSSGSRATIWSDVTDSYSYLSFFGRAEYSFDDRYYADLSVRTDASSRFGKSGRWAAFWSVGFMWNARKESFLESIYWLTNAQLAVSTGTSGNSSIPNYDHLALVGGGANYNDQMGIYPMQSGNEDLGWEKLWTTNIALHLGFWNRLNADIEFYNKLTTDMLMSVPVSYADKGEGFRWDNIGAMVNRGFELQLNADIIRHRNFVWNISANVSYNRNEITELYGDLDEYELSSTNTKLKKGHSVGEFYINRYAGVNPANGDALWLDAKGNITTEYRESDKVMLEGKSYIAPWQGGFGTSFMWNGFTLSTQFSWVADRWMFNNDRFFEESNGLYSAYNQSRRLLYERWKKPGDVTDIPRYGVTPQMDSRFLENASFLRLKNVMLSYSLPSSMLRKTKFFTAARIYIQAQNLFTLTPFSGLDPESSSNVYKAQYPMSRQYSMGIDLNF
ncbi:MAG: TonB-dependent receptor [Alistipes sp.]|nr:TonB-dependent receptor [Alistipes sp.]MBR4045382.1 TonB-dependent receptor [Alistipes sp.]